MGMFQQETVIAHTEHYTVTVCTPSGMIIVDGYDGTPKRYIGYSPYDAVLNWLWETYGDTVNVYRLARPVEHLQWIDEETE
jgi:hypothetical protein